MKTPALSVEEAIAHILAGAKPTTSEPVGLLDAVDRTLAEPLVAKLTQPPFDASAMDGYAVRADDVDTRPATLEIIGEAAAGHPFPGKVATGQAVRIFTGAPLPEGADAIVIQENTNRQGDRVTITEGTPDPAHIRPSGGDFASGTVMIEAGTALQPRHIALAAAMGHAELSVHRKPVVAILATGDELVEPGTAPGPGQIVASNSYAIAAMLTRAGADARLLGIASDTMESLAASLGQARDADVLITIGGASVGDHDLVSPALSKAGFDLDFWKIAMRPGKPLMFAKKPGQRAIGVPGNPVSSIICTAIFVLPLIAALSGRSLDAAATLQAPLTWPVGPNGPRQHYMRATLDHLENGQLQVTPASNQDSSLLSVLAYSNALIIREPHAPALSAGRNVTVLPIDF
ncbi:MAG: molybdopterin molybdotransferase MoeA [Alphaproteobacteria bacterium]|nr:molybdopterin molybdotransferase MoeA [Alphaproteobacteria bacterium]